MHGNRNGTSALPEQRDVVRIAAEGGDIVADPLEGHHLIEEACVPRNVGGSEVQEAEARHAILHRDEDHLLLGHQGFVIVNVESCRSGIEATCAQAYTRDSKERKRERENREKEKEKERNSTFTWRTTLISFTTPVDVVPTMDENTADVSRNNRGVENKRFPLVRSEATCEGASSHREKGVKHKGVELTTEYPYHNSSVGRPGPWHDDVHVKAILAQRRVRIPHSRARELTEHGVQNLHAAVGQRGGVQYTRPTFRWPWMPKPQGFCNNENNNLFCSSLALP